MRLYLVRHGRTANNVNHIAQGHLDSNLDDLGLVQAERVALVLKDLGLTRIFSSDLQRCVETARPTAKAYGIMVETTLLLRERSLGTLEGVPLTALRKAFDEEANRSRESRFKIKPCGSESAYEVYERATRFITLLPEEGSVAVFTHGMIEEVLLCKLLNSPPESSRSFSFDNASITSLRYTRDVWMLEEYNRTEHLTNL
jgi:glucosyl-3-phosphoglycerate phosphatase